MASFILIVMLSMSNISVGGTRLFLKGLVAHLLGGILAIILFGFNFQPQSTMLNIIFCLPTLTIYPILIGMVAYRLSLQLSKQRNELQATLDQVKTLSGLLPICASCKNIRDDNGYWKQIEQYIQHHSEAEFSHGICPECAKKLYPDFDLSNI
jgi:predicted membrane protein